MRPDLNRTLADHQATMAATVTIEGEDVGGEAQMSSEAKHIPSSARFLL